MKKTRIGIMGCGIISDIYIKNFQGMHSDVVELVAISSRHIERSRAVADKYGIPYAMEPEEFYSSDKFDLVVNLTVPKAHYEVCKKSLEAGKHIYTEKPLSLNYDEGEKLIKLAEEKGLYLGGAPDTFMGAAIQTARAAIEGGAIGRPIGFTAFMICHGWENWHTNPDFYYAKGGGPMYDMGPYYLTALVNMLGPVSAVSSMASNLITERQVQIGPRKGEPIPIETPTHIAGTVKLENGAVGSMITSFDLWAVEPHDLPRITVYGTKGSLVVPDPNFFGGSVRVLDGESGVWSELPHINAYTENSRGLGVRDMCLAIAEGRPARANAHMMNHVVEVMDAFLESAETGREVGIDSSFEKTALYTE